MTPEELTSIVIEPESSAGFRYALEISSHIMEFVVHQRITVADDGTSVWDSNNGPVYELDDATVYVSGSVKWDGCSNWDFGCAECLKHFCSREEAAELAVVIDRLYVLAAEHIPAWDRV